jgi:L-ascorbate metabolism protein UlaG (beta-lactamase superfamily)
MQLTKFKHACFTVTKDTNTIVVDPGTFSTDFVVPDNVVATIITHEHADHLDEKQLQAISERSPDMVVVAHESIASKLKRVKTRSVSAGDTIEISGFNLTFTGGEHATIAPNLPPLPNLGVHINQTLYDPGDSFTPPAGPVKVLALPAAAPWMKASEAIAFLASIKPEQAFPTHDAILSSEGKEIYDRLYEAAASNYNTRYQRISTPIDL